MTTFQQQALDLLKEFYDMHMEHNRAVVRPNDDPRGQDRVIALTEYLVTSGLIEVSWTLGGNPCSVRLLPSAINLIESPPPAVVPPSQVTFNIAGDNSGIIAGQNVHDIYIDNSITWQNLREEASKHNLPPIDKEQIDLLITLIEERMQEGKPIERGFLAPLSDLLVRYSWLSSAVASAILHYALK
jgi:hypothetical protein